MRKLAFFLFFLTIIFGRFVLAANDNNLSGEQLYKQKQYEAATKQFQKLLLKDPQSAKLQSNLACSLYQTKNLDEALTHWQTALKSTDDPLLSSRINYNIGNHYFNANQLDKAIEHYKTALRLNPDDLAAKHNLEVALKQQDPPPPSNSPNSNSNSNNDNNNDNNPPPDNSPSDVPKQTPQMSRNEAESLLNKLQSSERSPLKKGNKEANSSIEDSPDRDW